MILRIDLSNLPRALQACVMENAVEHDPYAYLVARIRVLAEEYIAYARPPMTHESIRRLEGFIRQEMPGLARVIGKFATDHDVVIVPIIRPLEGVDLDIENIPETLRGRFYNWAIKYRAMEAPGVTQLGVRSTYDVTIDKPVRASRVAVLQEGPETSASPMTRRSAEEIAKSILDDFERVRRSDLLDWEAEALQSIIIKTILRDR